MSIAITRERLRAHLVARYGTSDLRFQPLSNVAISAQGKFDLGVTPAELPDAFLNEVFAKAISAAPFPARALNRISYGATLVTISEFMNAGTTDASRHAAYLDRQLAWTAIDDSALEARIAAAGYRTLNKSVQQLWADHVRTNPAWEVRMRPAWEVQRAALVRAVYSKRQLHEVLVDFWHNHFNVAVTDNNAGPVFPQLDRVIRANALGNFRAMLGAVTQSTAMLYYLDNRSNTREGPNENFARELLELHTLGSENYLGFVDPFDVPPCPEAPDLPIGYTDIDVYETAAAFTGWTVRDGHWQFPNENDGAFTYRPTWHDAGPKFVLGKFIYPEQPALKDGNDILDRLAGHPRVAAHICRKLIRRFVTDTPPVELVESAAAVFRANIAHPSQIGVTLRHVLLSTAAVTGWGAKRRRPFEAVAATLRVLRSNWTPKVGDARSDTLFRMLGFAGHRPYEWPAPNGYPDLTSAWAGANTFVSQWRSLNWLTEAEDAAGIPISPILEISRVAIPPSQWTASNLVDYWCRRSLGNFVPATERRQVLVDFLAQNGDPNTYAIQDTDTWSATDPKRHFNQQRLRSMVALILMSPEFLVR